MMEETLSKPETVEQPDAGGHWVQRLVLPCGVTLYQGDCLDILPTLKAVDAVVTDPPYYSPETQISSGGNGHFDDRKKVMHEWRAEKSVLQTLCGFPKVAIWGGNYFQLPPSRGWLVWHKPDAVPTMANAELAWTNQNQNTCQKSWSIAATNAERVGHPTQKPQRIMSWTMEQVGIPEGAIVLDPYMGSGTTGIACIRTGRNFIGIEKDPEHFETARKRIEAELAQGDLFRQNDQAQPRRTND